MPSDPDGKRFNPGQPRVPLGSGRESGRWSGGSGSGASSLQLVSDAGRAVDLVDEEGRGGHAVKKHVGKSEEFLLNRVRTEVYRIGMFTIGLETAGTFTSLEAANKLVNSTLSDNAATVAKVVAGELDHARLDKLFEAATGFEAYRRNDRSQAYIRSTDSVRVIIVHDKSSPNGFRVITAFPTRRR